MFEINKICILQPNTQKVGFNPERTPNYKSGSINKPYKSWADKIVDKPSIYMDKQFQEIMITTTHQNFEDRHSDY